MAKLLRLRDYLLISAAFAGDLIDSTRLGWGVVPMTMRGRYGYIPSKYKPASYLSKVSRMLSTGDIRRVMDKKGNIQLELTSVGKESFNRRFPLFQQDKKWDGYFMIVTYDIAEETRLVRKGLRSKLSELGFGMLQESVWISPYHFEEDLREFLILNNLEDAALVLSAKKLWAGDLKKLAARVWKLKSVNKEYREVIKTLKNIKRPKEEGQKEFGKALSLYLDTLGIDPLLPKEFLPENWAQETALYWINKSLKE